jgi:hypothetical protein
MQSQLPAFTWHFSSTAHTKYFRCYLQQRYEGMICINSSSMFSTGTLVIILLILKVVSSVPNFAGIFKRLVALSLCVEPTKPQRNNIRESALLQEVYRAQNLVQWHQSIPVNLRKMPPCLQFPQDILVFLCYTKSNSFI